MFVVEYSAGNIVASCNASVYSCDEDRTPSEFAKRGVGNCIPSDSTIRRTDAAYHRPRHISTSTCACQTSPDDIMVPSYGMRDIRRGASDVGDSGDRVHSPHELPAGEHRIDRRGE
jgi:hypothetical protein